VKINLLSYSFDSTETIDNKNKYENEFNEYAIKNNLNVTLEAEVMKFENPTDSYSNFKLFVELSLKKSNSIKTSSNEIVHQGKFDIYIYNVKYTNIYGPYLLDLKENLSKEYIDMYDSKILNETSTHQNKLVGLPIYLSYDILYSNIELLTTEYMG